MERIFASFKDSSDGNTGSYDPGDPNSYEQFLNAMIKDARDYEGMVLAHTRDTAQKYYYGLLPTLYPDENPWSDTTIVMDPNATYEEVNRDDEDAANRSSFVSTDVRDAVMLMLPSLIRLFGASESPVELVPRTAAESDMAQQATTYVNYVFWNDNPGFLILYGAFKDAMTLKTGFVKWWTDDQKEKRRKTFMNITAQQIQQILVEDLSATIIEIGNPSRQPGGAPGMAPPPAGGMPTPSQAPPPPHPMGPGQPLSGPAGSPPGPGSINAPLPGAPGASPQASPGGLPSSLTVPPPPTYDNVVIEFEVAKPLIKVCGVPPEEMRLDRYARTFKESRIVGQERVVPIDELTAMGYPREMLLDFVQSQTIAEFTSEPYLRNPGRMMSTRVGDGVMYGEFYIKADQDGDGVPELRHVITMGENAKIISDDYANRIKFAMFSVDPVSHTVVGDSISDLVIDIQKIKTNLSRAVLDSAAESINPKTVINELVTTVDDALNDDLGAVIRTRGDPSQAVMFNAIPFLGQQMMPVIEYLNDTLQRRTGLSDAAKGLDPKALQSSTMVGVEAIINGQQERTELVARVLAETGFKDLFVGLFNEVCECPQQQRTLKIAGNFVDFDTSTFDASMAVEVNPTLGKGSDTVRLMTLQQIKQDQQLIVQQMGLNNPVCGIQEMMNVQTDMLSIANIKNVQRYFKMPNSQQMQALLAAPKEPDAMTLAAQAQYQKVKADAAEALGNQQLKEQQMNQQNDLAQQQLREKTLHDQAKIDLEAQALHASHTQALGKMASDMFKAQVQAETDRHVAHVQAQSDQAVAAKQAEAAAQQPAGDGT